MARGFDAVCLQWLTGFLNWLDLFLVRPLAMLKRPHAYFSMSRYVDLVCHRRLLVIVIHGLHPCFGHRLCAYYSVV